MTENVSASLLKRDTRLSNNNNSNTYKYKLDCQNIIDKSENSETKDWLILQNQIIHDSDEYTLFNALLEQNKQIVVKIGPEKLKNEFEIGKIIESLKIPTFLVYNCMFNCLDDFYKMDGKTQIEKQKENTKRKYLCKKEGKQIYILVMPYINNGVFCNYIWNIDNFIILKNIIKHIFISIIYASLTIGFIHNDLHLNNIMIQKTKRKKINYGDFYSLDIIGGIIPIIMDYDKSIIYGESVNYSLVYNDLINVFNLLNTQLKIKINFTQILNLFILMIKKNEKITKEICDEIINKIDNLEIYLDLHP
jgi:hypothetical protein